jgi:AraC family transcriptional regulator
MRLHLAEPITLADTAAAAGLSRFHWVRACKRATGMTPMRLLMRLRCEAAQVLLESSDLPLTDIAAETGFADASHLSHRYRLMMGCAPGALRRRR